MKIVLLEPIGIQPLLLNSFVDEFKENNHELIVYQSRPANESEIIQRSQNADVIIISNLPISKQVVDKCLNLKMISVAFTGVDHIPLSVCNERKIVVSNAAGYSTHAVAELTIGMAINLMREIVWADNQTRDGKTREGFLGTELFGKTFGIIGFGQIGAEVAKLANAFGCKVLVYSRTKKNLKDVEFVVLDELLSRSDIISLHLPLTSETKNIVGKRELDLLKPSAILINTARCPVVDYSALYSALKENKIAAAALDIYEKEPPLDRNYPFFELPNVLLLPHIGYATKEAIGLRSEIVFENIKKWMQGNPQNVMN